MTQIFGGLSIVILMGDFFQFPPITNRARLLWKKNNDTMNEEGRMVWERFNNVIILKESMQYHTDICFREMLARARTGTIQDADHISLNERVISSLNFRSNQPTPIIVQRNTL